MANNNLKKALKNLSAYKITFVEDSSYVYIKYQLKTGEIGGGADAKILKRECRIVDKKLYQ